ncbi:hypothetical protein SISNIDRAFT_473521 [Sistotremastrum niveocremeum HHB9708]|uniref:Glycosyltransferase family 32 protein n=1 Tax=Sistotremastrum niveocremeum HHB9708 TaxID=1314777 RepID=A0A164XN87_9AGAM|nr:hypothetical protein SISNIDRAFT_473521 [Sistotremastrum niveocremeum HHB9708]
MQSLFIPQRERSLKGRSSLPTFSTAFEEKQYLTSRPRSWFMVLTIPLPFLGSRKLNIPVPIPPRIYHIVLTRCGPRRGPAIIWVAFLLLFWIVYAFSRRYGSQDGKWPVPFTSDPPTLVYSREDLQRIWEWEISSGHYQSSRKIPDKIGFESPLNNPGIPRSKVPSSTLPNRFRPPSAKIRHVDYSIGIGPKRVYLDIQSQPPHVAYPPRPIPGSVADLDVVMDHCDFSTGKYVRDCLEILRLGGGLDNGNRVRRGQMDDWKYIYMEQSQAENDTTPLPPRTPPTSGYNQRASNEDIEAGFIFRDRALLENHPHLPPPIPYTPSVALSSPCDEDYPRVYHMFWTGPFTDKPYLALLSFLFTQNLGLHLPIGTPLPKVCRPKFWLWINPGPAASVPNPSAVHDMFDTLAANPWSSPFLHPRFKDVIEFKLWNTTEQLDNIPEIKDEWRDFEKTLFNSGGYVINVPQEAKQAALDNNKEDDPLEGAREETKASDPSPTNVAKGGDDNMFDRLGSKSASSYDRLSVILSDMARFILCHRFGGTYLDADTLLLRDWEELWGWKGAFAYRWSRLEKYNTAVLRLNKGSALGTFLFRTALRNGLDFHPMTVSRYTKDAYLEGLLLRLPDALFDSAWLNTEEYQRDRPPFPYFTEFGHLFETPKVDSAAPQALGFEGFFRGAYSYHFHNFWWKPFDPARNWPDLGQRFIKGETMAREKLAQEQSEPTPSGQEDREEHVSSDKRDLDWAAVLKRTFESYIRGERPNMYGEWITW